MNAKTFETGFGIPSPLGVIGESFTTVRGSGSDGEVFKAQFSTITFGLSLKKISPVIDQLPFPSIQNSALDKEFKGLEVPSSEDSARFFRKNPQLKN